MVVGRPGCSGSVSLYGIPGQEKEVQVASYDSKDPGAPVCTMILTLTNEGKLSVAEGNHCAYYHGASCTYDGVLTSDD